MAIDRTKLATDILESIGGADNVANVVHCATRLRFTLKDDSKANIEKTKQVYGVITAIYKSGVLQVVIGNTVNEVYKEVVKVGNITDTGNSSGGKTKMEGNIFARLGNMLISTITGIFPPILTPLIAAGFIMGICAIIQAAGWLDPESDTAMVLGAINSSVFFGFPVLLGFSAGRKFGGNPYLCAAIGLALIHPNMADLADKGAVDIFGIHLDSMMAFASTVLPIILAAYVSSKLEILLMKYVPAAIKNFLVPAVCLLLMVPFSIFILGPINVAVANGLGKVFEVLQQQQWLFGIIIGGIWQVLVIFGVHWGIVPLGWNQILTTGKDPLNPLTHVAALSQTGAAFGIFLKMKNKEEKAMVGSAVATGILGITEPIIYGITLKRKKQFAMGIVGGAIGGLIAGLMGAVSYSQGAYGFASLPNSIPPGSTEFGEFTNWTPFFGLLIGLCVSFGVAAILSFITYKDDTMTAAAVAASDSVDNGTSQPTGGASSQGGVVNQFEQFASLDSNEIGAPMAGDCKPLSQCSDPVFAEGSMGQGVVITPSEGKLYSPVDGEITLVFDTKHAVGVKGNNGVEMLIHVGIDTVSLNGEGFVAHVKAGDRVRAGQLLTEFDITKIKSKGLSLETPVLVTNKDNFGGFGIVGNGTVALGQKVIKL